MHLSKKEYNRGLAAQYWYNFTEVLALTLTYRPIPKDITYTKNVKYSNDKKNYINTFCRNDLKSIKKPLFIYIHGGGWISGITEMRNPYILNWAKLGFFACSISYSYAPQKVFPHQINEIFSAIDSIIDNAEQYNIDTDNVILCGESAGGYFVTYVTGCLDNPQQMDKIGIRFRNREKIKIKGVVSHCGCFFPENLIDRAKPQSDFPDIKIMTQSFIGIPMDELGSYLTSSSGELISPQFSCSYPPVFLTWCTRDKLRFETFELTDKLKSLGVAFDTFKGSGLIGNHAWTIVTMFSAAKDGLHKTFDFVLPYLPDYFIKNDKQWKFNYKTEELSL